MVLILFRIWCAADDVADETNLWHTMAQFPRNALSTKISLAQQSYACLNKGYKPSYIKTLSLLYDYTMSHV